MAVLILGDETEEHALHIFHYLKTQGKRVEFLDSASFPSEMALAYDPIHKTGLIGLPNGESLGFEEISSVYWRNYNGVNCAALPDEEQAFIAENDARSLFESLLIDLPTRWVNGWRAYQLHQTKPVQLARIAALGVPVPATVLTNDPQTVERFVGEHPRSIFKPVQGGAHAARLTPDHLTKDNLENLALAPVTIQEEIPGTNIRSFVAGDRVLSCELKTESLDYRDDPDPVIEQVSLPKDVEEQCLQIATALELVWTGIDFRRTPDGRHVFLEANPSPMFMGFEDRTGLPLTESLAELLI